MSTPTPFVADETAFVPVLMPHGDTHEAIPLVAVEDLEFFAEQAALGAEIARRFA